MSDVRSEKNVAAPQLSGEDDMDDTRSELSYLDIAELAQVPMDVEDDMNDTRSELSYLDVSELTQVPMDVETVRGMGGDRPDVDLESEESMSPIIDPVDTSAHSAQASLKAVPISNDLEARNADSNMETPVSRGPEGGSYTRMYFLLS